MILQGKNAIITGTNRGIGNAVLKKFAEEGCNIWTVIRHDSEDFRTCIDSLQQTYNVWIKTILVDLTDFNSVKNAVTAIRKEKLPVDILVNNAGVVGKNYLFEMTPINEMQKVFDTNFFAVMNLTQLVVRLMIRQGKGSIVNISSVAAFDGNPGQLEYSSSKGAIISATKKLSIELGKYNIRVNAIAPGMTDTEMVKNMSEELMEKELSRVTMRRLGKPNEVANAVAFFASDEASFITGQTLRVDGGIE